MMPEPPDPPGVPRTLPNDWYPGTLPPNIHIDPTAYLGTSQTFTRFRSTHPRALELGHGATLDDGALLDVGPNGRILIGDFAIITSVRMICDLEIRIDAHAMIAWNVLLMDSYRSHPNELGAALIHSPSSRFPPPGPIHIGRNAWIGFEACILPGVTIGENAIVGARAVVTTSIPANTIAAGNPARILRTLPPPSPPSPSSPPPIMPAPPA